jgi:hypothetical protein
MRGDAFAALGGLYPTEYALNIADIFLLIRLNSSDYLNSLSITYFQD